jgi:hypothetical protein
MEKELNWAIFMETADGLRIVERKETVDEADDYIEEQKLRFPHRFYHTEYWKNI